MAEIHRLSKHIEFDLDVDLWHDVILLVLMGIAAIAGERIMFARSTRYRNLLTKYGVN